MSRTRFLTAARTFSTSRFARLLQIAVTLAFVAWIISALDGRAWAAMRSIGPTVLVSAVATFASSQFFCGLRLALLLPGPLRWHDALAATWIGYFYGNFLPSTVGGDLIRVFRLKRTSIDVATIAGALLLDRLINLSALVVILMTTALPLGKALLSGVDPLAAIPVGLALLGVAGVGFGLVYANARIRNIAALVIFPLITVIQFPIRLAGAIILSFMSLGVAIMSEWLISRRLGLSVDLGQLTAVICLVTVIVLVPISLNGLGPQEAGFVVLLMRIGAPADLALAFSLLSRVLIVGASMVAGLIVLLDRVGELRRLQRK